MKKLILTVCIVLLLPSCSFLDEKTTLVVKDEVFSSENNIESLLIGAYSYLVKGGQVSYFRHLMTLEVRSSYIKGVGGNRGPGTEKNFDELDVFEFKRISSEDGRIRELWEDMYTIITQTNLIVEELTAEDFNVEMNELKKNRFVAEAKFLRALGYFTLVRCFGEVPLVINAPGTVEDFQDLFIPKNTTQEIYAQIIQDLKYTEKHTFYKPGSSLGDHNNTYNIVDQGRISKAAAKGMLAKVYLTLATCKDFAASDYSLYRDMYNWVDAAVYYDSAIVYAQKVIDMANSGGNIGLESDFTYLFNLGNSNNIESLFEIQHSERIDRGDRCGSLTGPFRSHTSAFTIPHPTSGFGLIAAADQLVNLFDYEYDFANKINYIDDTVRTYKKNEDEVDQIDTTYTDELKIKEKSDIRFFWTIYDYGYKIARTKPNLSKDDGLVKVQIINNNDLFVDDAEESLEAELGFGKHRFPSIPADYDNTGLNFMVLRYAEILLIYAEAVNELRGPGEAYPYINAIRQRARNGSSLFSYPASQYPEDASGLTQAGMREEIRKERIKELAVEGHIYFDQLRHGTLLDGLRDLQYYSNNNNPNPVWFGEMVEPVEKYMIMPIPQRALDKNPSLKQNLMW